VSKRGIFDPGGVAEIGDLVGCCDPSGVKNNNGDFTQFDGNGMLFEISL
jgi:hypothetical protein